MNKDFELNYGYKQYYKTNDNTIVEITGDKEARNPYQNDFNTLSHYVCNDPEYLGESDAAIINFQNKLLVNAIKDNVLGDHDLFYPTKEWVLNNCHVETQDVDGEKMFEVVFSPENNPYYGPNHREEQIFFVFEDDPIIEGFTTCDPETILNALADTVATELIETKFVPYEDEFDAKFFIETGIICANDFVDYVQVYNYDTHLYEGAVFTKDDLAREFNLLNTSYISPELYNEARDQLQVEFDTYQKWRDNEVFEAHEYDLQGNELDFCGNFYDIEAIENTFEIELVEELGSYSDINECIDNNIDKFEKEYSSLDAILKAAEEKSINSNKTTEYDLYVDFVTDINNLDIIKDVLIKNYNFELIEDDTYDTGLSVYVSSKSSGDEFDWLYADESYIADKDTFAITEEGINNACEGLYYGRIRDEYNLFDCEIGSQIREAMNKEIKSKDELEM